MDSPRDTKEKPMNLQNFHKKVEQKLKLAEKPKLKEKDVFVYKKKKSIKK